MPVIRLDNSRDNKYIWFVSGRLAREIKQSKPFALLEEEAALNILRTAGFLEQRIAEHLKEHELSGPQYNVLRILRGAGEGGATCSQVSERMVTRDPDITRLLDRLEARGLVERQRSDTDRRVVMTCITAAGTVLMEQLEQPNRLLVKSLMARISKPQLKLLIESLEAIRAGLE